MPMEILIFDLLTLRDPLLRAGLFGLWRVLKYGEHDDNYPGVKQTENLQWELGETTIKLTFRSFRDLIPLMRDMLGHFPHGIANPPGYESNPLASGFYMTLRVHQALFAYFRKKSGGARSESFALPKEEQKKAEKEQKILAWRKRFRNEPITEVATLLMPKRKEDDKDEPFKLETTPRMHCPEFPPEDLFMEEGKVKKSVGMKVVFHPACMAWRNKKIWKDPFDAFLIYFSCLSYVYTCNGKDSDGKDTYVGVAVDADTFTEADRYHRGWASSTEIMRIVTVWGDETMACWFIAAALGLPERTYLTLTPRGAGMFTPIAPAHPQTAVYEALRGMVRAVDVNEMLWTVDRIPIRKGKNPPSATERLVSNLADGATWCRGIEGALTVEKKGPDGKVYEGLSKRDKESLARVARILGGPMEKQVMQRMSKLYGSLIIHYKEHFGVGWPTARKKAMNFAVKSRLNGAHHRSTLLGAINEIRQEADSRVTFSQEESDWLIQHAGENPEDVRSMLILACGGIYDGTTESNASKDTPSEDDEDNSAVGAASR